MNPISGEQSPGGTKKNRQDGGWGIAFKSLREVGWTGIAHNPQTCYRGYELCVGTFTGYALRTPIVPPAHLVKKISIFELLWLATNVMNTS